MSKGMIFSNRFFRFAFLSLGLALAAASWSFGQTATMPATAASSTAPATSQAGEEISGPQSPLATASNIQEGLKLTEMEKTILSDTRDRSRQLDEKGLYVMLRRTAALPLLNPRQLDSLNQLSLENILIAPETYRGLPTKLKLAVFTVQEWKPGKQLSISKWWPKGRSVWCIKGIDVSGKEPSKLPVLVLSVMNPLDKLPTPSREEEDVKVFATAPRVEMAGVFYKVFADPSVGSKTQESAMTDYPVLLVWQVLPAAPLLTPPAQSPYNSPIVWIGVLVLLAVLFFYFRKAARQAKNAVHVGTVEFHRTRVDDLLKEESHEEVDPDLKAAAEQFRVQRQKNNAPNRKS